MTRVRSRVTTSLSTTRLRLEARRSIRPLIMIATGTALALACAYYIFAHIAKSIYTPTREVGFIVSDASGVVGGGRQQLEFKGIPAGTIDGTRILDGQAELDGSIYATFGPIYRDAHVTLRPATPLQDMVLDILDRGTPSSGLATTSTPVPLDRTSTSLQVGDVLDTFQPDVRTQLAETLSELGGGLSGRGAALRSTFVELVPFLRQAARLTSALAHRGTLTRQLVHNAALLTAELGRRQTELAGFVRETASTFQALHTQAPDLGATLQRLPPTLLALRSSFQAVRKDIPDLNQALTSLDPVAQTLPESLTAITELAHHALPAVQALTPSVRQLAPLSQSLRPLARNLEHTVKSLSPQVPAITTVVSATAECPAALQGFFQWTPSVAKFWTPTGPGIRGDFGFSADNTEILKDPNVIADPSCAPGAPAAGTPGPTLPSQTQP
jgi:phospholipid/cholesterol/gamma-HCH transport system substrate-binding protein